MRILRCGDLGALQPEWEGWVINRNGLFPPDGRRFDQGGMRRWWLTQNQAACFRRAYDEGRILGGVGHRPAVTLQPEVVQATVVTEALPSPQEAILQLAALLAPALRRMAIQADPGPSPSARRVPACRTLPTPEEPGLLPSQAPETQAEWGLPSIALGIVPTVNKGLKPLDRAQNGPKPCNLPPASNESQEI
ncbi:DUF3653 domain-containing protein [Pinirhizobacter soli]|uniref:DUF3653 domain-containing protein n=1 Tax=Pinirhizobacter soli TaxID=2786953 RepID=UPI003CE4B148